MKNLFIDSPNFVYLRVQWFTWQTGGLLSIGNFTPESAQVINQITNEVRTDYPIVLDFKDIENEMQGAFMELVQNINSQNRKVVFWNYIQLDQVINRYLTEIGLNISQKKTGNFLLLNSDGNDNLLNDLETAIVQECQNEIQRIIGRSFQLFDSKDYEFLTSTPIMATGEFNAANIISIPRDFILVSLALSDKLQQVLAQKTVGLNKHRILSVSMRGSIFASVISVINDMDIDIVDHLGPKQMILEYDVIENLKNNNEFDEYIYVGDFTVGGTEVKMARTFASLNDIFLSEAIVLGSLTSPNIFATQFNLHQLCSLKNLESEAKYKLEF